MQSGLMTTELWKTKEFSLNFNVTHHTFVQAACNDVKTIIVECCPNIKLLVLMATKFLTMESPQSWLTIT